MKVFINGTFDVLHQGHLELINYANSMKSYLLIAIDSTERIKSLKGDNRPLNTLEYRKILLESIKGVDEVVSFSSDHELESCIKYFKPDIMIVGSDYQNKNVIGSQYAKQLIFFPRNEKYSSTELISQYRKKLFHV